MKKLNFLMVLVALLSVATLTACKKEVTATGYGLVHKDYVGVATITVKGAEVTALEFEEVYLPSHWAGLVSTDGVSADLYLSYQGKYAPAYAAKYVMVGDKKFTASLVDGAPVYSADGIADLKAWVSSSEENAKWYAEELLAGNAKATDASWTKATFQITADAEGGFKKSTTGYWSGSNYPLGWAGNMDALEEAFIGTEMNLNVDNFTQGTDKTWSFDGITSSATLVDAKDYYAVALRAYNNATK